MAQLEMTNKQIKKHPTKKLKLEVTQSQTMLQRAALKQKILLSKALIPLAI